MIRNLFATSLVLILCTAGPALAQTGTAPVQDKRPKLGVAKVEALPTLAKSIAEKGQDKAASLGRVVDAIDGRLIDRLHNTRKFRVISRSDLDKLFVEQNFVASGSVNADDPSAARSFMIAGLDWLVVVTVDDMQDFVEVATFAGTGEQARKRVVRLGVVAKLYDSTTGELKESVSLQLGPGDPDYRKLRSVKEVRGYSKTDGNLDDDLLVKAAAVMADRVCNRVLDVLYPAKVIGKTGPQVMINRGDGTDISVGEIWGVFALGEAMIDPDTGISLGAEEVQVGKVRITAVQPLFSRSEIIEDFGIDKGHILRRDPSVQGKP